jgi:hypothetical protein
MLTISLSCLNKLEINYTSWLTIKTRKGRAIIALPFQLMGLLKYSNTSAIHQ